MNPTIFESIDKDQGMLRLKKAEKQATEKPYERPVQRTDHDHRRKKFKDVLDKKDRVENKKKSTTKTFGEEQEKAPVIRSLFDLARDDSGDLESALSDRDEPETLEVIEPVSHAPVMPKYEAPQIPKNQSPYYIATPMIAPLVQDTQPVVITPPRQKELINVIEQMAAAMKVMKTEDLTQTTVIVRYPPLFEGISFVITQIPTAPKELAIAFHNVFVPEARVLLESIHSQALLRARLIETGYTLQMVTIEPKLDKATTVVNTQEARQDAYSNARDNQDSPNKESRHKQ